MHWFHPYCILYLTTHCKTSIVTIATIIKHIANIVRMHHLKFIMQFIMLDFIVRITVSTTRMPCWGSWGTSARMTSSTRSTFSFEKIPIWKETKSFFHTTSSSYVRSYECSVKFVRQWQKVVLEVDGESGIFSYAFWEVLKTYSIYVKEYASSYT